MHLNNTGNFISPERNFVYPPVYPRTFPFPVGFEKQKTKQNTKRPFGIILSSGMKYFYTDTRLTASSSPTSVVRPGAYFSSRYYIFFFLLEPTG